MPSARVGKRLRSKSPLAPSQPVSHQHVPAIPANAITARTSAFVAEPASRPTNPTISSPARASRKRLDREF